jgi:hypothetical protein
MFRVQRFVSGEAKRCVWGWYQRGTDQVSGGGGRSVRLVRREMGVVGSCVDVWTSSYSTNRHVAQASESQPVEGHSGPRD